MPASIRYIETRVMAQAIAATVSPARALGRATARRMPTKTGIAAPLLND
jgi:hypothetical protein